MILLKIKIESRLVVNVPNARCRMYLFLSLFYVVASSRLFYKYNLGFKCYNNSLI